MQEQVNFTIPADAPAGTYRLDVEGATASGGLRIPVAPVGTPEVVAWEPGSAAEPGASGWTVQYWFFVPEDAETFYVDIIRGSNRVSIWDPEGGLAWDMQGGVISDRAEIEVEPGHAGRLWRITLPRIGRFRLDERIPPVLAVNPERWFMPDD